MSDDTLYLRLTKTTQRGYRFEFEPTNLDPLLVAVLEDSYTNEKTALSITAKSVHDFVINSDPKSAVANRFKIVFKQVAPAPLPVTHIRVKAYQQASDITVEWKVENELNIKEYEIERSKNGSDFSSMGTKLSLANNGNVVTYYWLDIKPVPGEYYYRIRSITKPGVIAYSDIAKVKINKSTPAIYIFPNPVTESRINLQMNNMPDGMYNMRLLNNLGQVIINKRIPHAAGTSIETLTPDYKLVAGIYQLEVIAPDKTKTIMRVIIK